MPQPLQLVAAVPLMKSWLLSSLLPDADCLSLSTASGVPPAELTPRNHQSTQEEVESQVQRGPQPLSPMARLVGEL